MIDRSRRNTWFRAAAGVASLAIVGLFVAALAADPAVAAHRFGILVCSKTPYCVTEHNKGTGPGLVGTAVASAGVDGETYNLSPSVAGHGVVGKNFSVAIDADPGVLGFSSEGTGILAESNYSTALVAVPSGLETKCSVSTGPGICTALLSHGNGGTAFVWTAGGVAQAFIDGSPEAALNPPTVVFEVLSPTQSILALFDAAGNLRLSGAIFTAGKCSTGCIVVKNAQGEKSMAYTARDSEPSMEDSGESRLIEGRAFVALDQRFLRSVDRLSGYDVYLGAEGESNGLFVAEKSFDGFKVQESAAGRSNIAFTYRIVARPSDYGHERLAPWRARSLGYDASVAQFERERSARARVLPNGPIAHRTRK